jgi:multiple sugar transport system substrate-binding protein
MTRAMTRFGALSRRSFLKRSASAVAAAAAVGRSPALAADPIYFATWSAAVDAVKSHLASFEGRTGLKVEYSNSPFAQYRDTMITKFVGKAPVDMLWVSDSWLPEWADAGWLVPIDAYKTLTAYNGDVDNFCNASMSYKDKQYGLTYYTDYMAFLYNAEILDKAGIKTPPATWVEVSEQARIIKAKGLSEYPVMIGLAQESWLIEFISALVFSHGGGLTDDQGNAAMQERTTLAALQWLIDAVHKDNILSPSCVETGELAALKAFSSGQNAFTLLPKYRLRSLNDKAQSQIAGKAKLALMPKGDGGSHSTVGWMRFYGMTPRAEADPVRAANTVKLVEYFGGKVDGEYRFQKLLFKDLGLGFGVKPLFQDPDIRAGYDSWADADLIAQQQALARKKDVVTTWFGEWNDVNGAAWQQALLRKLTPEQALKISADKWNALKKQG